jgi:uncharacterized protein YggE
MKLRFALATLLFVSTLVVAEDRIPPKVVRVVGTAEVKVVPDRAVIEIGVEKQNANAVVAKQLADRAARSLLASLHANGVDDNDVQTTFLTLRPQFDYRKGMRISYFVAAQTMSVTVRDLAKLDSLLESVIKAGGNWVNSIEYETSDLRKYRDQARDLAVKAAREKAKALAQALGQDIGKPYSIEEIPETSDVSLALANFSNEYSGIPAKRTRGPATSAGERTITASVTVSFDLN